MYILDKKKNYIIIYDVKFPLWALVKLLIALMNNLIYEFYNQPFYYNVIFFVSELWHYKKT